MNIKKIYFVFYLLLNIIIVFYNTSNTSWTVGIRARPEKNSNWVLKVFDLFTNNNRYLL